ncbi:MAG: sigma-70 family RNA polymerase sigma factor [Planctomycetia bacterium]|nr:sigma-70 family RNA polymerase sigma factor [Planctomycetia bacterium]
MSVPAANEQWQNDPDVQLMLKVRDGDAFAFEELMTRNQSRVLTLLQSMVGSREQAEDLTQEVFLRVYKARMNYQPEAQFSTWLYRIVHNLALNSLRMKHRRPELLFSGASTGSDPASSSAFSVEETFPEKSSLMPTRQVARNELQAVVRRAIDGLGERQRMAIILHRFEGMSYEQIAQVMEMSPKAIKSLLCRARVSLKEALRPYMEEGRNPS